MEHNLTISKAAIVAAWGSVTAFLGWKGLLALAWILVMFLDYASGTAAACKKGDWSSKMAREGLWHKCGMIFAVIVAGIADAVMAVIIGNIPLINIDWPGLVLPLVLAWYILTELGSILENAVKMGANVPEPLIKLLKVSLKAVEDADPADENKSEQAEDFWR